MPFVISNNPTYRFKVTVKRPNDETGGWDTLEFLGEFRRRSAVEIRTMFKNGAPDDDAIVASEFTGWSGVKQPDGSELEVNAGNRAVLLAQNGVQSGIVRSWVESSVTGPLKTSETK